MDELIKVNDNGERLTTSARDLWEGLDRPYEKFTKWFDAYKTYGFTDGEDYRAMCIKFHTAQGNETTATDYEITIDMAKQLAMLQKTEKGRLYRQYFLELEKRWNSPEHILNRALEISRKRILSLQEDLDFANKTKAYISDKKTATAVGRVGGLVKSNNRLREEVGFTRTHATIKKVEMATKRSFKWRLLKDYCKAHEITITSVPDVNYGFVNAYSAEAWYAVYDIDLEQLVRSDLEE
jgi:phage anti-repressor protein